MTWADRIIETPLGDLFGSIRIQYKFIAVCAVFVFLGIRHLISEWPYYREYDIASRTRYIGVIWVVVGRIVVIIILISSLTKE